MVETLSERRPTRRQRRSAETRERLLDGAEAVFLASGYDQVTLAEVTDRADVGTGTLYLYFRDKRTLYEAVVRRALSDLYQRWQQLVGTEDAHDARVLAMVRIALEFLTANPEKARLFLLDGPVAESWLVNELAKVIATLLDGPQRELRASMLIGATLAAARHHAQHDQRPSARTLVDTTVGFCAGGLAGPARRTSTAGRRGGKGAR
jgi:AcrR family transcriptional regulator